MEEKAKNTEAVLVISTGFLVLYMFFGAKWMLWTASSVSIVSLILPSIGKWIVWGWFKIGHLLGWINTRVLLTIVFFIFLVPVAFIANFFSKDKLQLKRKEEKKASYFINRNHKYSKKDLENVW